MDGELKIILLKCATHLERITDGLYHTRAGLEADIKRAKVEADSLARRLGNEVNNISSDITEIRLVCSAIRANVKTEED